MLLFLSLVFFNDLLLYKMLMQFLLDELLHDLTLNRIPNLILDQQQHQNILIFFNVYLHFKFCPLNLQIISILNLLLTQLFNKTFYIMESLNNNLQILNLNILIKLSTFFFNDLNSNNLCYFFYEIENF